MSEQIAKEAHVAATVLKTLSNEARTEALDLIHSALLQNKNEILEANKLDMDLAKQNNLKPSLVKRLDLSTGDKYDAMAQGITDVANLEDPVGKITLATKLDEGLNLYRLTCPVGTLLIIFESRPEVIANITALAIKSGNSAILKGGKESHHSFVAISKAINDALGKSQVPAGAIQLVSTRDEVSSLLSQDKYIDLVIPRGSNELVRQIKNNTKIPVLGHADGICSIYVDDDADLPMAQRIVVDAKTNYPAGCNAVETLLINRRNKKLIIGVLKSLFEAGVNIHPTQEIASIISSSDELSQFSSKVVPALESDFTTEFLSLDIAVKAVDSVSEAIAHINAHSSKHTDSIVTNNEENAQVFLKGIDSAGVYWNASTRFADGFRYGFGTEVGISTNKIHARGPVGLEGLVGYQYQIRGHGQVASDYIGAGGSKSFIHQKLDISTIHL